MAMKPIEALRKIATALTGDEVTNTGVYIGTYRQHAELQEALEVLRNTIQHTVPEGNSGPARSDIAPL